MGKVGMLGVGEKVKGREKRRKSKEQRMTAIRGLERSGLALNLILLYSAVGPRKIS